jgi:hypothetical protein
MSSYGRRCTWCNCTNNRALAYREEDYRPSVTLVIDPRDVTAIICSDCSDSVFDALSEFEEYEVNEDV